MPTRATTGFVFAAGIALLAALALGGCGGSGGGGGVSASFSIVPAPLPPVRSGELVDFEIPVAGGCGGPYTLELLSGEMPDGLRLDDEIVEIDGALEHRHHIVGHALSAGRFAFRLQIIDAGCEPFRSTTHTYEWSVDVGDVTIVAASPALVPAAAVSADDPYLDVDALPTQIYGQFTAIDLIAAGGYAPYVGAVIDDPNDPDDGPLPLGVVLAANSCSLVGAPSEVLPSGRPFRLTFRVTDARGATGIRKLQWVIATPPLVVATPATLGDGKAGTPYTESVQIAGGVPPFAFELVDDVPHESNEDFVYVSGQPPTFNSDTGFTVTAAGPASNYLNADGGASGGSTAVYPALTDTGPYEPMPPEGMYLGHGKGTSAPLLGVPRRVGDYTIHVHAYSTVVPNSPGQHVFSTHAFRIDPADTLAFDPVVTLEKAFASTAPYPHLPEFEMGLAYDPDGGVPGLQLLATGGVAQDEYLPAPHIDQRVQDTTATPGSYLYDVEWDPDGVGDTALGGVELTATGLLRTVDPDDLERQGDQLIELELTDHQIPPSTTTELVNVSVGPDVVIVTHSTVSWTGIYNYYSYSTRHEPNDNNLTIKKFQAFSSIPTRTDLDDSDLTPGTSIPDAANLGTAANPLGALLSGASGGDNDLDLLRCTINPTGWWDDVHGLNANGARPFQHSDPNQGHPYYAQAGASYYRNGNWQPSVSAVHLPAAAGVTENRAGGIYTSGGRCYHFESDNRFGVFIVRPDATVYVPFAMEKSSTAGEGGFGDGVFEAKSDSQQNSLLRTVQMTVSPDGRFAAMKLKRTPTDQLEVASSSRIVIFSLTGEALWGGKTYRIVDPDGAETGSGSRYVLANSMALTNRHLYFLLGTNTSSSYQSWSSHYIMRFDLLGTASDADMLDSDGSNTNWTQDVDVPMQTVFQHWYLSPYRESYTYYGSWPYHRYWFENGANFMENALAPMPFRVSRNGKACAILAGPNVVSTYDPDVYSNFLWVDYDGSGARQASKAARHATMGGGRGYSLSTGPSEYAMWGRGTGPTTGLEISDDGLRAAFVYTKTSGYVYASQSGTSTSNTILRERQDIVCCSTTPSDRWATATTTVEKEVTRDVFAGSHRWKFGALAFTGDDDGLVFWGGAPTLDATTTSSYYYMQSYHFNGTMYADSSLDSTTASVTSMFSTSDGGSPDGVKTYTAGSGAFNPTSTSGSNNRYGTLQPIGGFLSRNRDFLYICDLSAISATSQTGCQLVGLNVSTLSTGSINGHPNGRGFQLGNWPSRRGFLGNYSSYPAYPLRDSYGYAPAGHQGASRQVMAADTGCVFWGAHYQYSGPSKYSGSYDHYYGGPIYATYAYGCYGYGGTGIYGFNAEVGGSVYELHDPALASASTSIQDRLHYIEVADDGSKLAYVTSGYYYYSKYDAERVQVITELAFDETTGALNPDFVRSDHAARVSSGSGRSGEAMAIVPGGRDVYYAFKSSASNETSLEMVKLSIDPNTNTWSTKTFPTITGRMNVLFAGR